MQSRAVRLKPDTTGVAIRQLPNPRCSASSSSSRLATKPLLRRGAKTAIQLAVLFSNPRLSMSKKTAIFAAAVIASVALAAGYTETSLAQAPAPAPAPQASRQGRGGNAADSAAPARRQGDGAGPF